MLTYNLHNKIVLITGASSGIGAACAEIFASSGANLIITARRIEKLELLASDLTQKHNIKCLALQLDVTDSSAIKHLIANLDAAWANIDILINNAGLALGTDPIQNSDINNWNRMIDTNIKGLLYMTQSVLPGMVERKSGHIINIGSIAGRQSYAGGNIYSATKHAVRAISESLRIDLLGKNIRVTEIAPGAVATEFSEVRWNNKEKADAFYASFAALLPEDIADAVIYAASRAAHVNISEMVVYPTCQASSNHLFKEGNKDG